MNCERGRFRGEKFSTTTTNAIFFVGRFGQSINGEMCATNNKSSKNNFRSYVFLFCWPKTSGYAFCLEVCTARIWRSNLMYFCYPYNFYEIFVPKCIQNVNTLLSIPTNNNATAKTIVYSEKHHLLKWLQNSLYARLQLEIEYVCKKMRTCDSCWAYVWCARVLYYTIVVRTNNVIMCIPAIELWYRRRKMYDI